MRVGIYVKKPESVFSNGCIQQTYFLKKLFDNISWKTDLLSIESTYTRFELTNDPVIFTNETFDYSPYTCILLGSLVLLPETNQCIIDNLKKHKVNVINLICGNVYVLHQEEFLFDQHHIMGHYNQDYFTENWVLEMYEYAKDYVEMVSSKPTKIMPYVWDTDIIDEYVTKNNVLQSSRSIDCKKINLLMFEPNMSIHKNALVPLLIANEYYKMNKDRVNKVYMFCSDKILERSSLAVFLNKLELFRDKRIESYGRIIMPYIIDVIQKNNNYMNIVLSYNILNNLNFLHLEMFHLGIPIIHNCKPFEQNGMYFPDFELFRAVSLIESVRTTFNKTNYINKCKQIIQFFSPNNQERMDTYKQTLTQFIPNDIQEISIQEIIENKKEDYVDKSMFYQGSGYVIFYDEEDNNGLNKILGKISLDCEKTYVEVFMQKDLDNPKNVDHNDFVSITYIENKEKISYVDCIKYSSFQEVKFIQLSKLIEDVKVYTK